MKEQNPGDHPFPPLSSPWVWGVPLAGLLSLLLIQITGSNRALFLAINQFHLPGGTWAILTIMGDTVVALTLLLPFCGRRPDIIRALVVAALVATLTVHGLKALIGAARPLAVLGADAVHVVGPALTRGSFPSGHTTTIFTGAALLCLLCTRRGYRLALIAFAALVGLSRCGVGAHWPADVAAGAVNGWLAAVAGIYLARRWRGGLNPVAQRIFALILLLCALSLLGFYDTRYPQAVAAQYLVALLSLGLAASSLPHLIRRR